MNFNSILRYESGKLFWTIKPSAKVFVGDEAGSINDEGYIKVMYRRKSYPAHHIVWVMHNGEIPDGYEIDHENHIRSDNRIENLRLVTRLDNMKNKSAYSNNKSGVVGVSWSKRKNKWVSQIQHKGKKKMLYEGSSFEYAVAARKAAEAVLKFHANHGER
ncbi:HNH endonuclease [Klebsiella phage vB_KpnD_Opt-817]|uniref:HNH endonuclease n=1 Tax=Klebsiella phage vB_KpnD_Opt-817 TaxID=2902680 RepID=A0AC61TPU3_9CAUD|nr:HNH endonuclease [Klebsiella phage vB_KpnD_Opt-817]